MQNPNQLLKPLQLSNYYFCLLHITEGTIGYGLSNAILLPSQGHIRRSMIVSTTMHKVPDGTDHHEPYENNAGIIYTVVMHKNDSGPFDLLMVFVCTGKAAGIQNSTV